MHLQILTHESSRLSSDYGRYAFQQSVVRQVAYATLSLRDRKRIHLAVIASYGPLDTTTSDHASVLAQHHLDAINALPGDDDVPELRRAAVGLLLVAARRARTVGLLDESLDHLRGALEHETDEARRAHLQTELAEVLYDSTDWPGTERVARDAAQELERLGDEVAAASAWALYAMALVRQERFDEAEKVAWPLWERYRDDPTAAETAFALATALVLRYGRQNERWDDRLIPVVDAQVRLADRLGDPGKLADAVLTMALRYVDLGVSTLGAPLLATTARIARENQLPFQLARALLNDCAFTIGTDAERAVDVGREALVAGRRTGVLLWSSFCALNLGFALWVRGDWADLGALLERSETEWEEIGILDAIAQDGMLAFASSTPARMHAEPADPESFSLQVDQATAYFAHAARHAASGNLEDALSAAVAATERYGSPFDDYLHMWAFAADLADQVGDEQAEARLLGAVDPTNLWLPLGLRAHRARAGARRAVRAGAEAEVTEDALREAVSRYEEWGALAYAARARGELGAWLAQRGRSAEAEPLVSQAREELAARGANGWLGQLDAALVQA